MRSSSIIDPTYYSHSPLHKSVLSRDHSSLQKLLAAVPRIPSLSPTLTESQSLIDEAKSAAISALIDRRDVPARETPLHVAVRLGDPTAVELLMSAGADCSLHNIHGWSPLQEAILARHEQIAKIILRHHQSLAWLKWCRRMPRVVAAMNKMRDFYLEINFHFESSVIPFISRIAPSDTYRMWKRGPNFRADMTLSGFDGLRIKRAEQSILFSGGRLLVISHRDREVVDAFEGAGRFVSDAELQEEVDEMSQTDVLRPGIDITRSVLVPQMNWRNKQRSEMVGPWNAKVYNLHHVVVSVKSRSVPGVSDCKSEGEDDGFGDLLTEEERKKFEETLNMENKKARNSIDGDRDRHNENEFSKGLKPVLWLSSDFPLQVKELLPLLDILANKVKAISRLRELLTTKLPSGSFPVKVAIPVIPTVRVLVSFTKFEELQPERKLPVLNSANWAQWLISSNSTDNIQSKASSEHSNNSIDLQDPFTIPPNYVWTTSEAKKKKKKMQEASGKLKKR